ncbi:MAG TPA: sigma factor [Polyangiaceae bacterium]
MTSRDDDPPSDDEDGSSPDEDPPSSEESPDSDDDGPPSGEDPSAPSIDPALVRRFVATSEARSIAERVITALVPEQAVEELVGDAFVAAIKARPPSSEDKLAPWFASIARRKAARWLEKRKRRAKYEGRMPARAAGEDEYTGEPVEAAHDAREDTASVFGDDVPAAGVDLAEASDDDDDALLGGTLDRLIGDDADDRVTRDIIREKAETKKTYAQIAKERGTTHNAVHLRVYRFKEKYGARVRRRNRMVFFGKLFAAVAAALAVGAILWAIFQPRDEIRPDPSMNEPAHSASAEPSGFLQALPPPPEPTPPPQPSIRPKFPK